MFFNINYLIINIISICSCVVLNFHDFLRFNKKNINVL